MTKARLYLIVIGMAMVGLAAVVLVRDKSLDTELLGTGLVLGAIAIAIVVAINLRNGRDNGH